MSIRDELFKMIRSTGAELGAGFDDETSLLRSGVLDSSALFNLILFIEERIDSGVDLTTFDLRQEWDTVSSILAFIEKHRLEGKRPAPR
jgi:acyl carrier protein